MSSYFSSWPRRSRAASACGVGRRALEHLAVPLDGDVDEPHLALAQRREAQHQGELGVVVGRERELRLEVLGELRPHLLAREEIVERAEGAVAPRVELEHLLVRRDGVLRATEPLVVDLRHRGVERLAIARVVGLLDAALDDADEVLPSLRAREELLERRERFGVRRVEREHLVVGLRGAIDVPEPIVDAGDPHPVVAREQGVREACRELPVERDELASARRNPPRSARSRLASRPATDRRAAPRRGPRRRGPGR